MTKFSIAKVFERQKAATRSVHEGIEEIRLQVIVLQDQRDQLRRLPVDRQRALAALDDGIAQMAARLDARNLMAGLTRPSGGRPHFDLTTIPDALTPVWLAVLCPDRLRQHFADLIDDVYESRDDLPEAARAAEHARLDAEILSVELMEEALVRSAERAGLPVLRRADLDPRAALAHDDALPGG